MKLAAASAEASCEMSCEIVASIRDLHVRYPTRRKNILVNAVDGVSFDVRSGETFGIIGESGSGKTTLARALVFLTDITSGTIEHAGIDPHRLSRAAFRVHRRQ